ncbi:MAG: chloride channel protein [Ruminococcaceae bacterium]|nr:chloride channel protein [Oscillospiraceae bacterium]
MRKKSEKLNIGKLFRGILLWGLLGVLMGIVCGIVGAAFSHCVSFVTGIRGKSNLIIYLLPLGGLLSVFVYRIFNVTNFGTDDAVESAYSEKKVSPRLTPAVFICTVISHFFGASAGREGAALKMGGGIAELFSRVFRLDERGRRTIALAGMSGVFAAVFGTPVGAAVFTVEVVRSRFVRPWAIFTALISSVSSYFVALALGVSPERYNIGELPSFDLSVLWRVCALSALAGLVSYAFCFIMHLSPRLAKRFIKNDYLRIAVGALLIVGLTVIVGTTDYNGAGISVIHSIFEGNAMKNEAFVLKILFTAITVAAGFKGGEIVPAFFVGATFGAVVATLLGLSPALGAAVGMVALFCGVTNCPIATLILSVEMFGIEGILYFVIAVIFGFLLSGELSLYDRKKFPFKELREEKNSVNE